MQKEFKNITEFSHIKERCIFCQATLRAKLTNFIGVRKSGIPILNSVVKNDLVTLNINHTTEYYFVKATCSVDTKVNSIQFNIIEASGDVDKNGNDDTTKIFEQYLACLAFKDLKPYIQVYCPNKKCKMSYHLSSNVFVLSWNKEANHWDIAPPKLSYEIFIHDSNAIVSDHIAETTNIYSRNNIEGQPIKSPLIDFEEMGAAKLLTRIKTLVTFS